MPLSESFSTNQSLGYPNKINFTDTSTGSDVLVTARRIYIQDVDGNYIVEEGTTTDYEVWPYADSTITLDVLTQDTAANVTVQWVNSGGTALYEVTSPTVYRLYAITYYIYLIKAQASRPNLRFHANFYSNEIRLISSLREAYDAIYYAGDLGSAQAACNRSTVLISQPANFF